MRLTKVMVELGVALIQIQRAIGIMQGEGQSNEINGLIIERRQNMSRTPQRCNAAMQEHVNVQVKFGPFPDLREQRIEVPPVPVIEKVSA